MDQEKEKLSRDETLKLLDIVGSWKDREADRFWNRFNFVFVVNSALLAAAVLAHASSKQPLPLQLCGKPVSIVTVTCILGVVVSVIWFFLLRSAKEYEARLIKDIDRILEDQKMFKERVKGYSDKSAGTEITKATTYAKVIPWLFVTFWIVLVVGSI